MVKENVTQPAEMKLDFFGRTRLLITLGDIKLDIAAEPDGGMSLYGFRRRGGKGFITAPVRLKPTTDGKGYRINICKSNSPTLNSPPGRQPRPPRQRG